MSKWNVYAEIDGSPVYAEIEIDCNANDDLLAFEAVVDEFRSTLQIDPVED